MLFSEVPTDPGEDKNMGLLIGLPAAGLTVLVIIVIILGAVFRCKRPPNNLHHQPSPEPSIILPPHKTLEYRPSTVSSTYDTLDSQGMVENMAGHERLEDDQYITVPPRLSPNSGYAKPVTVVDN